MYIVGVNKNEVDKMKFSREMARTAADRKYIAETDKICNLLKNRDIEGIKEYLSNYEKQKERYASHRFHWTRSGTVLAMIADMKTIAKLAA